ncbi:MAG TPA: 4Fe-4S binding protein [Bacteroidales bacterium]|nr:4Fe-4S binding protein [Bacteroidales bacterium]
MIRKIIQWSVIAFLTFVLVFFSVKQYQIAHPQQATENKTEISAPVDTATSSCEETSCGACPSKDNCNGKASNATIPKSDGKDEFKEASTDEFTEVSSDEFQDASATSEFEDVSASEFQDVTDTTSQAQAAPVVEEKPKVDLTKYYPTFIRFSILFILLGLISIFYHKNWIHYFRYPILLGSLIYFGFILGGCPCILVMFNDSLLLLSGKGMLWVYPTILLSIVLLTILFGKIWCGWLCHFGALQEFLFRNPRMKLWRTKRTQKILHFVQTFSFLALTIWILFAQINIVCTYDPFVKIFTFSGSGWLAYTLIGLLIISSLLVYRPFCRAVCPIGLILNWSSRLPFANKIVLDGCTGCKKCHKYCKMGSIQDKKVDMACIACGECNQSKCEGIQLK